jgi:hypothetical protein
MTSRRGCVVFAAIVACGKAGPAHGPADSGIATGSDAAAPACALGAVQCEGYDTIQTCVASGWSSAPCASPAACLDNTCTTTCTDTCNLGDTRTGSDGTMQTCQLWSVATRMPVMAGSGLADRARLYNAYLRDNGMPAGQVTYMEYATSDLTTIAGYSDQGDSAIFTGTYLAAEALRYKATQSPDALANVTAIVQTLHTLWNVAGSGSPGYLARFAAPTTSSATLLDSSFSSSDPYDHFSASYAGQTYDWKGHVSRDQYQGVVLGYSVAYDVLTDETVRDLIRGDMVTFANELMKTRTLYPTIDGVPSPIPFNVQYCVLTDQEPLNIQIGSGTEALTGIQEFMPSLFGLYPEPTSAIQLTSAFEVALQVTANQPAWATQNQAIQAFFDTNVNSWLSVAQKWSYGRDCGNSYFANNIAFEPMYDLARLDTDPTRSALIRGTILEQNMWQKGVIGDKNSWFAYIYAADAPAGSTGSESAVAMANAQIAQFTPPPRVHLAVSNSFPADPNCPGQALDAIDVGQRVINDFDWQRGAWQEVDPGLPTEVYPGVDYLAAYWLARASGFLADDAPGQCTQWQ